MNNVLASPQTTGGDLYLTKLNGLYDHRAVMAGFPRYEGSSPRKHFGVLFSHHCDHTLVQSHVKPNWEDIFPKCLPHARGSVSCYTIKTYIPNPDIGERYYFHTVINPIKTVRGRRIGCDEREWLDRRDIGVTFEDITIDRGFSLESSHGRQIPVTRSTVTGILTVTDPEKLILAIRNGIGKARAYGCGLLLLSGNP